MAGFNINPSEQLHAAHTSHVIPGMFSLSGNAISKFSTVLIEWNEAIYRLVTKCVIYANDSLCWVICFNSWIYCSCLNVYWDTVFSITYEGGINSRALT